MSSVNPSEQILNLFNEYRENESAIEQLKVQLRQNNVACENLRRSLNLTMDTVAKLEFDHQQLRKVAVESPSSKNLTDICCTGTGRCPRTSCLFGRSSAERERTPVDDIH
jgi:predicted RNase H-like nuclease (RuvC/YqgF family)